MYPTMKKLLLLAFIFACCSTLLVAQNKNLITGTVYDNSTKEAVIQAGVRILKAKDSTFVTGVATDLDGKFSVRVNPGRYIVNITYLGYSEAYLNADASRRSAALGDIFLKDDGILLKEAVVTAKAAEIAIKGDTVEYNADSYKVQESAVVEDLLKKMPGAEVDADGKITVNGKEVKKILVDGKEFFSSDPKVASKNLPAQMVDKLQVLDRKSDMAQMTGFDDGEEETVINLTVKKGMKQGLFGNLSAGAGNHDRYGVSGIANYMRNDNQFTFIGGSNNTNNEGFTDNAGSSFRGGGGRGLNFGGRNGIIKSINGGFNFAITSSDKLKWGGNLRLGDTDNNVESTSYTEKYASKEDLENRYTYENGRGENKSTNIGADFRFEWTPDTLTKIIFSPNFQYGKNKNIQATDFITTYEDPTDSINWGRTDDYSKTNSNSGNARLDISRQLGKKGRVLSFSLSGGFNNQDSDGSSMSHTTYANTSVGDSIVLLDRIYNQKNNGYNFRAYVSYVEPIGRNNFIQFNYNFRRNHSESDRKTFLNDGTDQYTVVDTTATKSLRNNFTNQEIGLNFKSVREKYNYTIGVAIQPSNSESRTITTHGNSNVSINVVNFAPVAQFNYMWDRRHNLRLNYNGSTTQPSVTQLSDVRDESNPNNIRYGNPDLKPSFTHRFRIRYQKFNPEQASAFMLFGGLNFTNNAIVTKSINRPNGGQESTYENSNGNWDADMRMIINRPLRNKKFSINSMTYFGNRVNNAFIDDGKNKENVFTIAENIGIQFRSDLFDMSLRGNINYSNSSNSINSKFDRSTYRYGGSFNTTWYLPYNFTIDTDLNYSGNHGYSDGFDQNEWLWNASVSKQLFKAKNGTIKFNIYDILQQRTNISQSQSVTQYMETRTNTINSYFTFSFIYRFQFFKGGAKMADMDSGRGPGRGGRPGGSGRPRF